eukprot:jgi/Tetstr1/435515/TSEL_024419.t1
MSGTKLRFLGLGSGTTATHGLMNLFCEYGIPSIHYWDTCHLDRATGELHAHLMDSVWCLTKAGHACELAKGMNAGKCTVGAARELIQRNLQNLLRHGSAQALFDFPFPELAEPLAAMVPDALVVQSLRDGNVWTGNRYSDHVNTPICRDGMHNALDLFNCRQDTEPCSRLPNMRELEPSGHNQIAQHSFYERNADIRSLFPKRNIHEACAWDDSFTSVEIQLRNMGYRRVSGSSALFTDSNQPQPSVPMWRISQIEQNLEVIQAVEQANGESPG